MKLQDIDKACNSDSASCYAVEIQDYDDDSPESIRHFDSCFSSLVKGEHTPINLSCSQDALQIHKRYLPPATRFVCHSCDKTFSKYSALQRHELIHTERALFSCETCNKSFTAESNLRVHETIHTDDRPFLCAGCNKTFTTLSSLRRHESIHTGEGAFVCSTCSKRFTGLSNLRRHETMHSGERLFICGICNRTFTQESNLRSHMVIHTGERPFMCEVCHKRFTHLSSLSRHERFCTGEHLFNFTPYETPANNIVKTNTVEINTTEPLLTERLFVCESCDRRFTHMSNLRRHERFHMGERPFGCDVCNKQFVLKEHLVRHKRIHTGERPFVCETCKKAFTQASNLRAHKFTHASVLPFVCDICNKIFTRRSNLIRHKMAHSEHCSILLPQKNEENERIVEGEETLVNCVDAHASAFPFACDMCGKSFTRKSNLIRHKLKHLEQDSFHPVRQNDETEKNSSDSKCGQTSVHGLHSKETPMLVQKFGCGICGVLFDAETLARSCFFEHQEVSSGSFC